ncbi:MAG: nucleoside phosphorylase [Desulfobacteraceae bacterium]|nr:nucleoside phosphorylase [Desulfobacteraceae bacterium]
MVSTEPDLKNIKSKWKHDKASPFFIGTLFTPDGCEKGISVAGPFIGAPYSAMLLESLIAKGAKKILVLGWCGALSGELETGDLLVPEKAIIDEGTSHHYQKLDKDLPVSHPGSDLTVDFLAHLQSFGSENKKGTIWTTDAIYRETKNKVAFYRDLGAKAVEMECSALFSIAAYHKVELTSLLVVSDSVAQKDWNPGFRKKHFKNARQTACNAIMSFALKLSENEQKD